MPLSKPDQRRAMRAQLRALTGREEKSRALCLALCKYPAYAAARTVGLFDALPSEPLVELLWELAPRRFAYPRVEGPELRLYQVREISELTADPALRFREPAAEESRRVEVDELDLILVPGLAFTVAGHRLGRGGGHYDRLLARLPAGTKRLGVCFGVQVVEELMLEAHDMRLDGLVTEGGVIDADKCDAAE